MYNLEIRNLAKSDIQQIVNYFDETTNSQITDDFLSDLYANFEFLIDNPFLFQLKHKNIRICYLNNFSFGIHYTVDNIVVEVLAVLHTSQNPEIWAKR